MWSNVKDECDQQLQQQLPTRGPKAQRQTCLLDSKRSMWGWSPPNTAVTQKYEQEMKECIYSSAKTTDWWGFWLIWDEDNKWLQRPESNIRPLTGEQSGKDIKKWVITMSTADKTGAAELKSMHQFTHLFILHVSMIQEEILPMLTCTYLRNEWWTVEYLCSEDY